MSPSFSSTTALIGGTIVVAVIYISKLIPSVPLISNFVFPLSQVPGPYNASWSKIWLWRTLASYKAEAKFIEINKQYGPLARIGPKHLLTSDPATIQHVLAAESGYKRCPYFETLTTDSSQKNLVSERDSKKHLQLRELFDSALRAYGFERFERVLDQHVAAWILKHGREQSSTQRPRPVDLSQSITLLAVDIASHLSVGEPFGCVEANRDQFGFLKMMRSTTAAQQFYSIFVGLYNTLRPFSKTFVGKALITSGENSPDTERILEVLKEMIASGNLGRPATEISLVGQCIAVGLPLEHAERHALLLVSSASDTVSTTIQGTLLAIISNSRICVKLQDEIDRLLSHYQLPFPAPDIFLRELEYLQACILEGLRLYPPMIWLRERVVPPNGDYIQGYRIPGDTCIGLNVAGAQLDSAWSDDPRIFSPERWLLLEDEQQKSNMLDILDLVFGGGQTRCFGPKIAYMEMRKVIFETMRNFDLSTRNPLRPWKRNSYGVFFQEDFVVDLRPRDTFDTAFRFGSNSTPGA